MPPKQIVRLLDVVDKLRKIADDKYKGELQANILSIFNQLSVAEKKTLLRTTVNVSVIMAEEANHLRIDIADVKRAVTDSGDNIEKELKNIDNFNHIELIRLKSWMVKTGVIALIIGLVFVSASMMFFSTEASKLTGALSGIINVVKVAIGM